MNDLLCVYMCVYVYVCVCVCMCMCVCSSSSFCGADGIPPSALQPCEAYCTNPVYLQRRSTSDGGRDLY
jgi:hypothetical protein